MCRLTFTLMKSESVGCAHVHLKGEKTLLDLLAGRGSSVSLLKGLERLWFDESGHFSAWMQQRCPKTTGEERQQRNLCSRNAVEFIKEKKDTVSPAAPFQTVCLCCPLLVSQVNTKMPKVCGQQGATQNNAHVFSFVNKPVKTNIRPNFSTIKILFYFAWFSLKCFLWCRW